MTMDTDVNLQIVRGLREVDQVIDFVLEDLVVVVELAIAQIRLALDDLLHIRA